MSSRLARSLLVTLVALAPLVTSVASAQQSDDERAHAHFLAGSSYFDQRHYEEAAGQFLEAFRLSGRSLLLLNVATSWERAEHFTEAADTLDQYLSAEPTSDERVTLEERVRQLRARAEEAAAAATSVPPPDTTTPPAPAASSGLSDLAIIGIIVGGVGVAAGIAAIGTGVAALDTHASLESRCGPMRDACPAGFQSDVDSGSALALANTVLIPISLVALGTGITLLVIGLGEHSGDTPTATTLRVTPGPGDAGLQVIGTF